MPKIHKNNPKYKTIYHLVGVATQKIRDDLQRDTRNGKIRL